MTKTSASDALQRACGWCEQAGYGAFPLSEPPARSGRVRPLQRETSGRVTQTQAIWVATRSLPSQGNTGAEGFFHTPPAGPARPAARKGGKHVRHQICKSEPGCGQGEHPQEVPGRKDPHGRRSHRHGRGTESGEDERRRAESQPQQRVQADRPADEGRQEGRSGRSQETGHRDGRRTGSA